jgi:hypothetical protein
MNGWLRRARGAVGMGITWALGWALAGVVIGLLSTLLPGAVWEAFFRIFDAPLPALAIPGFFAGTIFSVVLGVAARRRRFDQLSLTRFALWGALGGLALSLVPATLVFLDLATLNDGAAGIWPVTAVIAAPLALLSALSAAGSLAIARRAERSALGAGRQRDLISS